MQNQTYFLNPGGMPMPMLGRQFSSSSYRYGFNGQEKDDEIKGEGNSLNYTYRMHDPRIGRFFMVDPLNKDYPFYSPYAFSGNRVIDAVELEGLEPAQIKEIKDFTRPKQVVLASSTIRVNVEQGALNYINNGGQKKPLITPEAVQTLGGGMELFGYGLSLIPHPVAQVAGKIITPIGLYMSTAGTVADVGLELADGNIKTGLIKASSSFVFNKAGQGSSMFFKGADEVLTNTPIMNKTTDLIMQGGIKILEPEITKDIVIKFVNQLTPSTRNVPSNNVQVPLLPKPYNNE